MVCVLVPLLLKRKFGVLFGVLRGPHGDSALSFSLLWLCSYIMGIIYIYIYSHCISVTTN
jgi:hypothetical protein